MRLRTNSKLNLFLRVLGRRADGYHEIETIFHGIDLADDVSVTPTSSGNLEVSMRFEEEDLGTIPPAEENLVSEVARLLVERGAVDGGARVAITKRVPIGGGLGGGSANAAGVLVALNELWEANLAGDDLAALAAEIGTDVPYCLTGGTALATSRGDELTQLVAPEPMHFVLGMSREPLYTRDVYPLWDPDGAGPEAAGAPMALALGGGDAMEVAALLRNDLEPAIFKLRPELRDKKERVVAAGALGALVTGSGPTIFGVARDASHAEEVGASVSDIFDRTVAVSSSPRGIERLD